MMLRDMCAILWAPLVKRVPVTLTLLWIFGGMSIKALQLRMVPKATSF